MSKKDKWLAALYFAKQNTSMYLVDGINVSDTLGEIIEYMETKWRRHEKESIKIQYQ